MACLHAEIRRNEFSSGNPYWQCTSCYMPFVHQADEELKRERIYRLLQAVSLMDQGFEDRGPGFKFYASIESLADRAESLLAEIEKRQEGK